MGCGDARRLRWACCPLSVDVPPLGGAQIAGVVPGSDRNAGKVTHRSLELGHGARAQVCVDVVEDQQRRRTQERSSQEEECTLLCVEWGSTLAELGVQPLRQGVQGLGETYPAQRLLHVIIAAVGAAVARGAKERSPLQA